MKLDYKWVALSNTTIAMLMASINQTVILIGLPAIFAGLHVDPLAPGQSNLLLWLMMGNTAVTTMFLVSFGRLADMFGRVKLFTLGFAVFTAGSLLCALTPSAGTTGALELIAFRVVQAIGGAMIFSNSIAILTDSFPAHQRGMALGVNQIAFIGGNVIGVVLGGLLAAINWRLDFLISVPVGVAGSIWALIALKEIGKREVQPLDYLGNLTFAGALLLLMLGLTAALMPYGGDAMGWSNPVVMVSLAAGVLLLVAFVVIENKVSCPMFDLALFKIRGFLFGNIAAFLFSLARGGLMFMLVIWLQGIWLPLHGVAYKDTPLWAGIDTMPMMVGFVLCAPLGGWLSDKYGARFVATAGISLAGLAAVLLMTLPANFGLPSLAFYLLVMGSGLGFFSAPNTSQVMSSLPPEHRGSGSGMRSMILNAGVTASQAVFFTVVIASLSRGLGPQLDAGAVAAGLPAPVGHVLGQLPAGSAVFAALLGYNPIVHLVPPTVLATLTPAALARVQDGHFFAGLLAQPFVEGIRYTLALCVGVCILAGIASALRGSPPVRKTRVAPGTAVPSGGTAALAAAKSASRSA
jgi:MFS family permease